MHSSMEPSDPLTARLTTVITLLMKGSHSETMEVASAYDLTLSQLRVLFVLDSSDLDLAVNEIAERISLSMPATGRAIDALHKTGLVQRREDGIDRRIKRITLTAVGTDAITRITAARVAGLQAFVDSLSGDERAQLEDATNTLNAITANHLPSHPQFCAPAPAHPSSATSETTA